MVARYDWISWCTTLTLLAHGFRLDEIVTGNDEPVLSLMHETRMENKGHEEHTGHEEPRWHSLLTRRKCILGVVFGDFRQDKGTTAPHGAKPVSVMPQD